MEYMFILFSEDTMEAEGPKPGTPEFAAYMAKWAAFNQTLMEGGHWVAGAGLAPAATATTLTVGKDEVVDGPYVETKEQLGGFYVVKAENLDEALKLAALVPLPSGHIEIRPVEFRPDADRG